MHRNTVVRYTVVVVVTPKQTRPVDKRTGWPHVQVDGHSLVTFTLAVHGHT